MSAKQSTATKTAKTAASASSVADFKKRKKGVALELPSGLMVVARRVELRTFIQQDHDIPNPLLQIVEEALSKGQGADIDSMVGGVDGKIDLDMVNDMYDMVDAVCIQTLVEPQVLAVPEDENDRDDELLYTDEVEDEDKMFLFQWATGGTADLASFREEAISSLDALAQGEKPGTAAKRAASSRKR